jgi:hypothetical protein
LEKFSPPHSVLGLEPVIPAGSLKVTIFFLDHHHRDFPGLERLGMAKIFIRPGPTKQYSVAQTIFFIGWFFLAGNHVFRAWNGRNEQGLNELGKPLLKKKRAGILHSIKTSPLWYIGGELVFMRASHVFIVPHTRGREDGDKGGKKKKEKKGGHEPNTKQSACFATKGGRGEVARAK